MTTVVPPPTLVQIIIDRPGLDFLGLDDKGRVWEGTHDGRGRGSVHRVIRWVEVTQEFYPLDGVA